MDPTTGSLSFCCGAFEVGRKLTRSQFLVSGLAQGARINVRNEPWCSWNLDERPDSGPQLSAKLYFDGERLASVELCDTSGQDRGWNDGWREEERLREERHAAWVLDVLDGRTTFPWGTVWSGIDARVGSAVIVVRYASA